VSARLVWTIFCDGAYRDIGCGSWIGKHPTQDEVRALARQHGWVKSGPDTWLCPRCVKHRKREERKR